MPPRLEFTVFADYNQFFVLDDELEPQYPESISQSAIDDRCQVQPSILAVYTAFPREVAVGIRVCDNIPDIAGGCWAHVIRGAFAIPSGQLVLAGCSDYLPDCTRIQVPRGMLEFLLCGRGFDAQAQEKYLLALWPGQFRLVEVVKRHVAHDG